MQARADGAGPLLVAREQPICFIPDLGWSYFSLESTHYNIYYFQTTCKAVIEKNIVMGSLGRRDQIWGRILIVAIYGNDFSCVFKVIFCEF